MDIYGPRVFGYHKYKCRVQKEVRIVNSITKTKISVITPSYNSGLFLKHSIDSVRNQIYRPVEHIIYDNCSTDETKNILMEYRKNTRDVEVKIVVESDKGQSDAINKGFKTATGSVVAWLNADEYYLLDTFQNVIEFWNKNPDVDLVFGDCVFVDSQRKVLKRKKEFAFNYKMLLYYGCYIPSCATFIKKSIIDENLLLDTTYYNCMDFEYYVRLANLGKKFKYLPKELAYFICHGDNVSCAFSKRRKEERLRVQLKYGFNIGYRKLQSILLYGLKLFYIFKRNLLRFEMKLLL